MQIILSVTEALQVNLKKKKEKLNFRCFRNALDISSSLTTHFEI